MKAAVQFAAKASDLPADVPGAEQEAEFLDAHGLNTEDTPIPEGYPAPGLWRVLIMPVQPKKKSAGGLILTMNTQDAEGHLQYIGKVVEVGPVSFRKFIFCTGLRDLLRVLTGRPVAAAPKPGDWVVYGRHAGQKCEYKGVRFLFVNDDEILAKVSGPDGFRIYV